MKLPFCLSADSKQEDISINTKEVYWGTNFYLKSPTLNEKFCGARARGSQKSSSKEFLPSPLYLFFKQTLAANLAVLSKNIIMIKSEVRKTTLCASLELRWKAKKKKLKLLSRQNSFFAQKRVKKYNISNVKLYEKRVECVHYLHAFSAPSKPTERKTVWQLETATAREQARRKNFKLWI